MLAYSMRQLLKLSWQSEKILSHIERNSNLVDSDQVQSVIRVTDFNDSSIDVL